MIPAPAVYKPVYKPAHVRRCNLVCSADRVMPRIGRTMRKTRVWTCTGDTVVMD